MTNDKNLPVALQTGDECPSARACLYAGKVHLNRVFTGRQAEGPGSEVGPSTRAQGPGSEVSNSTRAPGSEVGSMK